jgi:hypothetical protein
VTSEANFTTLNGLPVSSRDRIVGSENPHLLATLAETLVLGRLVLTAAELGPEFPIGGAIALAGRHEYLVMLALDFLQPVAHRGEEVLIGGDDGAVEIEFDHRLRTADGGNLAGILHVADFLRRDVGGELDNFDGPAGVVQNRIVGRLDPDLATALADALVFSRLKFTAVEAGPKRFISLAAAQLRRREHLMMLALDFIETVAHRVEEILVGNDDRAVHLELDHRLRPVDRGRLRQCITGRRIVFPQRHKKLLLKFRHGRGLICRRCTVRIPIDPYFLGVRLSPVGK